MQAHAAAESQLIRTKGAATQMCQIKNSPADSHLWQAGCSWPHSQGRAGPVQGVLADNSQLAYIAVTALQVT